MKDMFIDNNAWATAFADISEFKGQRIKKGLYRSEEAEQARRELVRAKDSLLDCTDSSKWADTLLAIWKMYDEIYPLVKSEKKLVELTKKLNKQLASNTPEGMSFKEYLEKIHAEFRRSYDYWMNHR